MATIRYQHFARPGFLKRIRADVLRQFLDPYRHYLSTRGLDFAGAIDCEQLGGILATPDSDTPKNLVEALEMCDAVCSVECFDELVELDALRDEQMLDGNHSHTDVVLVTWIHDPDAVERIFNRAALDVDRSLHVYRASTPIRAGAFGRRRLALLARSLRPMFAGQLRGSSCRITAHVRVDGGHALVIRHGDPISKTEAIDDESGETEPIVFRPESADVAFYDSSRREWRISGRGKTLQEIYTEKIAAALHEPGCVLVRSSCYTLEPLVTNGLAAFDLQTETVRDVRLAELQMSLLGSTMRLTGRDLDHAYAVMENPISEYGEPKSARLAFTLANRRSQLNVAIHEGRATVKGDIDHPDIEEWLVLAGFLNFESDEIGTVACN